MTTPPNGDLSRHLYFPLIEPHETSCMEIGPHPWASAPMTPQPEEFARKQGESELTVRSPLSGSQKRGSTKTSVDLNW